MSNTSRTIRQNLLKNSLGILISRVLTISVSFLSVPFIIGKLGISGYGTWEAIVAVSALCNIFQGVITGTLLWMISSAFGSKETESVHQYIRMGIFVALVLSLVIIPTTWFFRHYLVEVFKIPPQYIHVAEWILPCIVGFSLLGNLNQIMGTVIGGYQRAGATTLTLAIANIANYTLVIVCLLLGLGFWSLLIGFAAGFLFSSIGLYHIAQRIAGPFCLVPLLPSYAVLTKIAPYVGFMLLGVLSVGLRDQTDKAILASVASPTWTGYYGIAARLAALITIMCTFFYIPTTATSGSLYAKRDYESINRVYSDVITTISFLVGIVAVLLAGLHDRLIFLWTGKLIPEAGLMVYFLVFGNVIAVILAGTGSAVCKGTGKIRIETIYIVIGLLLNILLKFILVPIIGAVGTVAASSVSWAVSSVVFIILLHRMTNIPTSGTMKAVKTLFVIAFTIIFVRWFASLFPVEETFRSVLFSTVELGAVSTITFVLLMILFKIIPITTLRRIIALIKNKLHYCM